MKSIILPSLNLISFGPIFLSTTCGKSSKSNSDKSGNTKLGCKACSVGPKSSSVSEPIACMSSVKSGICKSGIVLSGVKNPPVTGGTIFVKVLAWVLIAFKSGSGLIIFKGPPTSLAIRSIVANPKPFGKGTPILT